MTKIMDSISVFFPAYNEEESILGTVMKAKQILQKISDKWEIIIVNDGSEDKTMEICNKLCKQDERIRLINHLQNRGYGASLKSGFYNSKYPWICFTDADGQFDFFDIEKFIQKQKETKSDLVIGYYLKRKVSMLTIFTSRIWEAIIFTLFGLKVKDIDCGFKLVSKKVIDTIPKLESERGAFISSELLIKADRAGFKFSEVGVKHFPRKSGKGTGRSRKVILESFLDLFKLWKKVTFSKK